MCVRCCQPFVTGAASGVSEVNPNGHVVRLSVVGCCQRFVAEAAFFFGVYGLVFLSVLWYLRLTIVCWLGSIRFLVSEMDPLSVLCWHCCGSTRLLFLKWILEVLSLEPSLANQISAWGRLWSMNSWVMASMMNYLIKNISKLFIVLYDHIAIYSKSARPTFSKADTETDCSSQKLHMFRHGFPLPSLSTGWPGLGGKRIGFAF
jgi:hypothetical protein